MDPAEVFMLAEVYRAQREAEARAVQTVDTAVTLLDILQEPAVAKSRLTRMTLSLEDMTAQERRLIGLYDQAIDRLEGGAPAPATTDPVTRAPKKG